jgi:hypothetical protein
MAITITIGSTVIEFPEAGTSPNWAEAVDSFAVAVADNLNAAVGAGDVLPNTFVIDALNGAALTNIPGFTFDTTIVHSTEITYSLIRQRDATTLVESGIMHAVYNPNGAASEKFIITRDYTSDAQVTFDITDTGQVQIATTAISGVGAHSGTLSFAARSLLSS